MTFNSLTMNITDAVMSQALGIGMNWLYGQNPFQGNSGFYYDKDGGGIVNVLASTAINSAANALTEMALDAYKKLLGMNKRDEFLKMKGDAYYSILIEEGTKKDNRYGQMDTGDGVYRAYDSSGDICRDALMLGIPVKEKVRLTQSTGKLNESKIYQSSKLIWYDTTAIISIKSDRNLLQTKVVGRDYSRKELVSNGDIEFTVSGTMSSDLPDVYPSNEIQKFIQVMQYKGAIEVNNQFLDQFNIKKIVVKGYDLPQQEGFKNIQKYSFTAVGIQPDDDVEVKEDTVRIIDTAMTDISASSNVWGDILGNAGADILNQGMSMGAGMLDNIF